MRRSQAVYLAIGITRWHQHLHAGAKHTLRVPTPSLKTAAAVKPLALLKARGGPCLLRPPPVTNRVKQRVRAHLHPCYARPPAGSVGVRRNRPDRPRAA